MPNGVCITKALLLFDSLTVTSLIINALRTKVFDQEDIQSSQKSTFIQYSAILRKIDNITQDQLFISFFMFFPIIAYYKINGSDGKVSDCSVGDLSSIPSPGKIPWRRIWQHTPVLLPGKIKWTEEPGGLQNMGLQRIRHS